MNYGEVEFEGRQLKLTEQAELTSRLLDNLTNYHEASEGEKYFFEMSAQAVGSNGNEYTVYWIFSDTKGSEAELDSHDYDDYDRIEPL